MSGDDEYILLESNDGDNEGEEETAENDQDDKMADPIAEAYRQHGGDPRELDLGRSLLVAKLPSAFLHDSFEVFSECVSELLSEEFKITREAVERIIRVPKLQSDAENPDNGLRALVMFKSRVHKHRVIAQQKLATLDGTLLVEPIEEIPAEMLELDDVEVADEVGEDDESPKESHIKQTDTEDIEQKGSNEDEPKKVLTITPEKKSVMKAKVDKLKTPEAKKEQQKKEIKDAQAEKKEERPKKAYIDDDLKAPFEVSWEGAPEFQWKICSSPGDSRRLTIENLFYADLRNAFLYRVMAKAESVDISFPMRYNLQGNKQMYGKMVVNFQHPAEVMTEAVRHLIYVRCPEGRRIKVYLPQTPAAMKQKDELEEKLGRIIKPTARMYQLVLKILPKEEYSLNDTKSWFSEVADQIVNWEQIEDEIGQHVGLVTFATPEAAVHAHSAHTFLNVATSTDRTAKVHVFMRGVEAHFGSLLTRWDQKKAREFYGEPAKVVPIKRPGIADSRTPIAAKRGRGMAVPGRGTRGSRGGYSAIPSGDRTSYTTPYRAAQPFSNSLRGESYNRNRSTTNVWRTDYATPDRSTEGPTRFPPTSGYNESRRSSHSEPQYYHHLSSGYTRR